MTLMSPINQKKKKKWIQIKKNIFKNEKKKSKKKWIRGLLEVVSRNCFFYHVITVVLLSKFVLNISRVVSYSCVYRHIIKIFICGLCLLHIRSTKNWKTLEICIKFAYVFLYVNLKKNSTNTKGCYIIDLFISLF